MHFAWSKNPSRVVKKMTEHSKVWNGKQTKMNGRIDGGMQREQEREMKKGGGMERERDGARGREI